MKLNSIKPGVVLWFGLLLAGRAEVLLPTTNGPEPEATQGLRREMDFLADSRSATAMPSFLRTLLLQSDTNSSPGANLAGVDSCQQQPNHPEQDFQEALALLNGRLNRGDQTHDRLDMVKHLTGLATRLDDMNRHADSVPLWVAAEGMQWRLLVRDFSGFNHGQKCQLLEQLGFSERPRLWALAFQQQAADGEAVLQSCMRHKQLFTEAARAEQAALLAVGSESTPAWRSQWEQYQALRCRYVTLALPGYELVGGPTNSFDADQVRATAAQIAGLEAKLRQGNAAYARAARLKELTPRDVRASLRTGEALVEFVVYEPFQPGVRTNAPARYGALVLQAGSTNAPQLVDLGSAAAIDAAVQNYTSGIRAQIKEWSSLTPAPPTMRSASVLNALASAALRQQVWTPLEPHLRGAKRVYVGPAGQLNVLPFESLVREGPDGWRYLVEDLELVYVGSSRDLARLALTTDTASTNRVAVLIGNPNFDLAPDRRQQVAPAVGRRNLPWLATLGTGGAGGDFVPWRQYPELDALTALAARRLRAQEWVVTVLTNEAAVKEAVFQVARPGILQFATHGQVVALTNRMAWDNPLLRSRLILAGANQRDVNAAGAAGVLTAYEVAGLALQGTVLVNLTACETALGDVTGEGVAGLRQAFWVAGARAVTASLWELPTRETTEQMAEFYEQWLGGQQTTQYGAFRAAQLAALARARFSGQRSAAHPSLWAGLIYFGDPGDLHTAPKN